VRAERLSSEDVGRLGGAAGVARHLRARVPARDSVESAVATILADVAVRGDAAVLDLTRAHDTAGASPRPLPVSPADLDAAIKTLPLDVVAGLQVAIANVAQVAQAGVDAEVGVELAQGQHVTLRELPVRAAAVYVPGGRAPYPSTAVMGVVTARAAGVLDVVVCSPPGATGEIDPAVLGACRLLGVQRVYRMGGAQAVAALAFGTESVAAVDVIVGPGNLFVQEAKRQLADRVGIDGFAGPSDLVVVFGADADPRLVALDLAAQAEHGPGSLVAALCPDATALDRLAQELAHLGDAPAGAAAGSEDGPSAPAGLGAQPGGAQARGARVGEEVSRGAPSRARAIEGTNGGTSTGAACVLVQCADVPEAVEIANQFAPEHLQLIGAEPEALASRVRTAGCLFVGAAAATAFGDYVAGSNHILPTGGAARFASGLSVRHFRRRMAEVRLGPVGGETATKLAAAGAPVARAEGFEWHARSMEARAGGSELHARSPEARAEGFASHASSIEARIGENPNQ
jgi:histidinol dehydrogenase